MANLTWQGWVQLGELTLAFVLSALVGLERELRQKSAGLRTYTLVGVSAALFMLVSKYGFMDVLDAGRVRAVGTHAELLAADPLYAELAATQLLTPTEEAV